MAGSASLGDYVMLGGNSGVADHVFIGKGAKVAAKAGVGQDLAPGMEVFGLFADERKAAFKQVAAMRRLPDLLERVRKIEKDLGKLLQDGK
jgi:UDP-3-O-[3-hydroxymyristoyl] glucosamine N-acyltransferase